MPVNEAYLKELLEDRKAVYEPLHKQIRANRDLRYGRHEINIPEAYKTTTQEIRSSVVADMLFRIVATLTTDAPVVTVPPYSVHENAKKNSNLRERWSWSALGQMMREIERPVLRMGIDAAVGDSLCIWKLIERKDAWKGFPRRKGAGTDEEEEAKAYLERSEKFAKSAPFPFIWNDIDPLTYFPVDDGYGVKEVLEVTKRPAIPAMKQFNKRRSPGGKFENRRTGEAVSEDNSYAGVSWDCVEHWSEKGQEVTYMLDGEIVDQRKVEYGRVPYFVCGGHTTSSRKPEEHYQSVIQPFAHLVPALDAMLSMMTNWGYFTAYPFLIKGPNFKSEVGPADPTSITEIEPGTLLEDVSFLEAPGTAKALADLVGIINQMIDRSGLAAVMYGAGASSSSGYMVSQLMTAAQLVYAPIVDNARMALEAMIPFIWKLVEKRKGRTVYVWGQGAKQGQKEWLGLGPDDIDGYYACEVKLKPLLPMDEVAQRDSAGRMVDKRLWSRRRAMEHIGVEQPEDAMDEIYVEELMDSPKLKEQLMQDAAERAGVLKPEPPPQPAPPPGMPSEDMPPGGGGFPEIQGMQPQIPGVNMPLVPPAPTNAGMPPPEVAQRQPGGNFGGPVGGV